MSGFLIALAIAVTIVAAIWMYIGPWAVFLLIFGIIFLIYRFEKRSKLQKDRNVDALVDTQYVQSAMQFIEFYEQLPRKMMLIITPEYIGVRVPSDEKNDYFGTAVFTYLNSIQRDPLHEAAYKEVFFKYAEKALGGNRGITLFQQLYLQVRLHDNDDDCPMVYKDLYEFDFSKRENYVKAIERQYKSTYHKDVKIYHLNSY